MIKEVLTILTTIKLHSTDLVWQSIANYNRKPFCHSEIMSQVNEEINRMVISTAQIHLRILVFFFFRPVKEDISFTFTALDSS